LLFVFTFVKQQSKWATTSPRSTAEAEMRNHECVECTRLRKQVAGAFEKILKLTAAQLEAFRSSEEYMFTRLQEAVQTAVSEKELAILALRQHQAVHE
jgi:hypothetical protein